MTEFRSIAGPLPPIPDDLTIPQFIFGTHATRPHRAEAIPWLINADTGRAVRQAEMLQRTHGLANAMSSRWNITNPAYKTDELVHQLRTTKAALLITHPAFLDTAQAAAKEVGLSEDRIVFFEPVSSPTPHTNLEELINHGISTPRTYTERRFKAGEAKTTVAFLSFSSGTTGKPKAVAIPHYSVVSNVIQMTTHYKLNDPAQKSKHFIPGDVGIAVLPFFHIYGLVVNLHFLLFAGVSVKQEN
ncbi:hypothetical protein DXG03_008906 [Asterophora parasitica]|uniref:AMP-dependent synthetase/ligase domain-containing protein n=1 Tax=Asterophora parasitica TaxID=117018 RepID=A0A9P7GF68_9AGAR|nr:hypothetical protein DXG03_008906 [Asterophora parasitica]